MHAGAAKRMVLWKCLQLPLIPFFPHSTHSLFWRHSHKTYNTPFTSIADVPRERTALKNSHRWCCTPSASVTSQTAPHCSPHLAQPSPEARLSPLVIWGRRSPKGLFSSASLWVCLQAVPRPSRHQHHTLLAVISGPISGLLYLSYLCCQLLL